MALGLNNDNSDLSRKLDGFVSAREFGLQNPVVDKFFSARSQSLATLDTDTYEARVAAHEKSQGVFDYKANPTHSELLKRLSGAVTTSGSDDRDTAEDRRRAERKKETEQYVSQMSQIVDQTVSAYSGLKFSVSHEQAESIMARRKDTATKMEQAYDEIGTPVTVQIYNGDMVERKQITIDGQKYTVNGIGAVFHENGDSLSKEEEAVLLKSSDPDALSLKKLLDVRDERASTAHEDNMILHRYGEEQSMSNYQAQLLDIDGRRRDMAAADENVRAWESQNPDVKREFIVDGEKVVMDDKGRFRDPSGEIVASDDVRVVMQPGEEKVFELQELMIKRNVATSMLTNSEREIAARAEATSTAPRTASAVGATGMVGEEPISTKSSLSAFNSSAAGTVTPTPAADNDLAATQTGPQMTQGQSLRLVGGL